MSKPVPLKPEEYPKCAICRYASIKEPTDAEYLAYVPTTIRGVPDSDDIRIPQRDRTYFDWTLCCAKHRKERKDCLAYKLVRDEDARVLPR